jgi:hypothetical protein
VNVRFACPVCEHPARLEIGGQVDWRCPACDHWIHVEPVSADLPICPLCGNRELYKKKDFPHGLGLAILTAACLTSVFTYGWYEKWLTWAILIGSAILDGILYLCVGDAVVCYRCLAHYRGTATAHQPFELTIGERYRQEKLRREKLKNPS